ncbi:hypothetical protein NFI96_026288 [Prochilodus magdalenae]|nr:hypothetical protein NFI96_026288 [Prochilodus magdalenae]
MKTSWMGLVLGLVLLIVVSSDAGPLVFEHPGLCCFKFTTSEIPKTEIKEIVETHHGCPLHGFVVTTPKGKFCKKNVQLS